MRRLKPGRGMVVVLTAALLASTASLAYAATDGKTNHRPTVIVNKGEGPALVLRNRSGNAPLAVGSSTKVANLNADQVDGSDAAQLEPDTMLWSLGHAGQQLNRVVTFAVPSGWYEASAHATAIVNDDKSHLSGCFVYPQLQVETGDYTNLLAAQLTTTFRPMLSVAGDIFIEPNDRVVIQCTADGDPTAVTLQGAVTFTLRPIKVTSGPGAATTLRSKAGPIALALSLQR